MDRRTIASDVPKEEAELQAPNGSDAEGAG
jgi:hypothetical protein